jgi:hypothetical protein
MTIKKSLISMAAASLLVAAMTGCSDDSSSSTPTPTPSTVTSVTATDGYVYNYGVTVTYSDGNSSAKNYTTSAALTDAVKMTTKAAGKRQVAGSAVMSLSELNSTVLDNLKSVNLFTKGQSSDGTTITYATFFDANGNGEFNTTEGDYYVPTGGFTMSTPAGFKVISPITTIVNSRITTLMASESNDSNRSEITSLALSKVATALGLTSDKIKNVDPMDTVSSDPAYALINALMGQVIIDGEESAVATSLVSATAPATVSDALKNIAAGATSSKSLFTDAANQLAADSDMINSVSSWNLDDLRSRTMGTAKTTFTPTELTSGSADFNVTAITIGGKNTSELAGSGAKIAAGALDVTKITFDSANDTNISNKPIKFVMQIGAQEAWRAADANVSSLTVSMPMDINGTDGTVNGVISGDITWEGVDIEGNTFYGDMNKSAFTTKVGTPIAFASSVLTLTVADILTTIDTNSSSKAGLDIDNSISNVKIALVNGTTSIQQIDNSGSTNKTKYWGNTAIASVLGGINVTGKTILKNALVDGRQGGGATAAVNVKPNNTFNVSGANRGVTGGATSSTDTNATARIVFNNDTNRSVSLTKSAVDSLEENTTIAFTLGDMLTDTNLTLLSKKLKSTSTAAANAVTNAFEINTTSTEAGELNTTITTVVTDEFGEANTTVTYITVNRAPVYDTRKVIDVNLSDENTSAPLIADYDGTANGNKIHTVVKVKDGNSSRYFPITHAAWSDINLTKTFHGKVRLSDDNRSIEINSTIVQNNKVSDLDLNLTVNVATAYDQYNAFLENNATDYNLTH